MALNGSLSEFSVAEVLQLLALQQKSGVLVLKHDDARSHALFFERGRILAAADRRRDSRHPFLHSLLDHMHITREQMETIEDISRETNQDLFTVILTTGILGRDRLGEEMMRYTQRLMDDLIGWKAGTYEFSGDERSVPHQGLVVKASPEELLMESMRRNDELATLKDSLIGSDMVLAKAPNPPGGPLPKECTVVLKLVDGRRTVAEICAKSPMGDYLTYEAITELLGRQELIVLDAEQAARLRSREHGKIRFSPLAWVAVLVPVAASVFLGLFAGPLLAGDPDRGWLPGEVAASRAEVRTQVTNEISRLAATLPPED